MRVIFLDIDGVLVTERLFRRREGRNKCADDDCVAALNRVLAESGAKIVISSSWRFCGLNEMRRILDFWDVKGEIVGMTPDLCAVGDGPNDPIYKAAPRGAEIQAWLNQHPEVDAFVILDDEADMEDLKSHTIKTTFERGFREEHIYAALSIVGGNEAR